MWVWVPGKSLFFLFEPRDGGNSHPWLCIKAQGECFFKMLMPMPPHSHRLGIKVSWLADTDMF